MPTKRFVVTGRVQGVGFRFFTATSATRNGLYGFVRNQADGSVEVIASGEPRGLNVLHSELSRGPRSARVKQVSVEDCEFREQWESFEIR